MTWEKLGVLLSNRLEQIEKDYKEKNLGPAVISLNQSVAALHMIADAVGIKQVEQKTSEQIMSELSNRVECVHIPICKHFKEG